MTPVSSGARRRRAPSPLRSALIGAQLCKRILEIASDTLSHSMLDELKTAYVPACAAHCARDAPLTRLAVAMHVGKTRSTA